MMLPTLACQLTFSPECDPRLDDPGLDFPELDPQAGPGVNGSAPGTPASVPLAMMLHGVTVETVHDGTLMLHVPTGPPGAPGTTVSGLVLAVPVNTATPLSADAGDGEVAERPAATRTTRTSLRIRFT